MNIALMCSIQFLVFLLPLIPKSCTNLCVIRLILSCKDIALSEAEKIVESVKESIFATQQGIQKITLSGGLSLKIPSKTLEESLPDVAKLVEKAKESGGNRVAQLRDKADMYR